MTMFIIMLPQIKPLSTEGAGPLRCHGVTHYVPTEAQNGQTKHRL